MSETPAYAPGCFGSALTFKAADAVCTTCPFASACEPAHMAAVAELRMRLGIPEKKIAAKKVAAPAPVAPAPVAATVLPPKVRQLLSLLDTGDFDVVGKLKRGENPFAGKMPFLQIVCHLLLRLHKPVSRDLIVTAFETKLGWAPEKAREHAIIATYALVHVGAARRNTEGHLMLKGA